MRIGNPGVAVDTQAVENGRWFEWPADVGAGALRVCIASWDSVAWQAAITTAGLNEPGVTVERRAALMQDLVPQVLIRDWTGMVDVHGQPVPFTPETAAAVCRNDDNRRFLAWVINQAAVLRNFDADLAARVAEAAEKN